jgi:hypothetical protein
MKTTRKILIGIISFMAVFAVGLFIWAQQPTQFTIAVTGQSGLPFTGVVKVDGAVMSVSGVVPMNYFVIGRSVDCRFQRQQVGGALGLCVRMKYLNGTCSVTTPETGKGVCAFLSLHKADCRTF